VDKSAVGHRIAVIMRKAGITQRQLADSLGISQPAVSLYLQGRLPPPDVLLKIARLGNTSMEWLLTGEEDGNAPVPSTGVREPSEPYAPHARLLRLWSALPPAIREDLLRLMQHISDNIASASEERNG